jgi:cytochrome P450
MADIVGGGGGVGDRVSTAQGGTQGLAPPSPQLPNFDPKAARHGRGTLVMWFTNPRNIVFRLSRAFWPVLAFPGCPVLVSRYAHVAEVLSRHDVFKVPFDTEIARLNDGKAPGTPFLLGIDDEAQHAAQLKPVLSAFRRSDVAERVAPCAREAAGRILDRIGAKTFNAIKELITAVPVELCRAYYGVTIDDPEKFAYATMELSGHLFGPPPPRSTPQVEAAGAYVRDVIDRAIAAQVPGSGKETVLRRLVDRLNQPLGAPTREDIRAFLIGMIVGFVPTNTIAGGNILEMLLRKPEYLRRATQAACAGDDDLLKHCLFEAMRFMPLNPGPFRRCTRDFVLGANTSRPALIKAGKYVLASTASAMFDPRQVDNPGAYRPDRPASDYMLFGYGMHFCAGLFIAQAQITQTLKELLKRGTPRRVSTLRRRDVFPDELLIKVE